MELHDQATYLDKPHHPSLPLQILLFLNVYLAPIWFVSTAFTTYEEFLSLSAIHQTITLLALALVTPIELLRLFLGYSGNLKDKIPDFAGFWILSAFLQFPMQLYFSLAAPHITRHALTLTIQGTMQFFLVFEIIIAFYCIKRSSKERAQLFHLKQLLRRRDGTD